MNLEIRSKPLGPLARIGLALLLVGVAAAPARAESQLFFDDFAGDALDTAKWAVLSGGSGISVSGSLLTMAGGPDHKRINSLAEWAPTTGSIVATARFKIESPGATHSYQKFGFNVNGTHESPDAGFYFDTYDDRFGPVTDHIYAIVWVPPHTNTLLTQVQVTWSEFHDFSVEWTPTEIIFSIDGAEVARVSDAWTIPLPVGVWNDRGHQMQTDWVEVTQRARGVAIDVKPGSDPNCFNLNGNGVIPVAILGEPDFDVTAINPDSLLFDGLAVRVRGRRGPLCSFEEVTGDAYLDLVCHFEDDPDFWSGGETSATVTGELFDGTAIEGTDEICIVP